MRGSDVCGSAVLSIGVPMSERAGWSSGTSQYKPGWPKVSRLDYELMSSDETTCTHCCQIYFSLGQSAHLRLLARGL